jgi:uncharacterized membrane protein YozB (DUF420 family)
MHHLGGVPGFVREPPRVADLLFRTRSDPVHRIYFTILTSHTVLAAVIGPFVIATLYRGLKGRFDDHKRLARLVYPIWLYVSVTGVIVYLMLYQIYYTPR